MSEEEPICEHCGKPDDTDEPCGYCCEDHDIEIVGMNSTPTTPLDSFSGEFQCSYCHTLWNFGATPE